MIENAEQFRKLRESLDPNDYGRAATEAASIETWENVLKEFPDLTIWIVHNKTVQLEILRKLALSPDEKIRMAVAGKRKLDRGLFENLLVDASENVRAALARNSKLPKDLLAQLEHDMSDFVRETVHNLLKDDEKKFS